MCATDVQDVRSGPDRSPADSGPGDGLLPSLPLLPFLPCWPPVACWPPEWVTELVDADRAPAPPPSAAAPDAAAPDAAGTATSPPRPAQATTRTPAAPVAAVSLGTPRLASRLVLSRRQARAIAPCRIGSSTNFHDSAAMPMLAAICAMARGRFSVPLAGDVSTMT